MWRSGAALASLEKSPMRRGRIADVAPMRHRGVVAPGTVQAPNVVRYHRSRIRIDSASIFDRQTKSGPLRAENRVPAAPIEE
jgi:hypothetical protein